MVVVKDGKTPSGREESKPAGGAEMMLIVSSDKLSIGLSQKKTHKEN